jgi:exopolysaccharide production protein ExoZ
MSCTLSIYLLGEDVKLAERINTIQGLRGAAATMVAGFHLWTQTITHKDGLFSIFQHGESGVDIFFVISGFIIYFTAHGRSNLTISSFAALRFWRILPPYWAILVCYILSLIVLSTVTGDNSELPSITSLAVSFFLLPYPDHIIIIAWTLSVELLFYLVFAITFIRGGPRLFFLAMATWILASQVYTHGNFGSSPWLNFILHTAVLEFFWGAVVAHLYLTGQRRFRNLALALGVALLGLYFADILRLPIGREWMPGVPAALVVYGLLGRKWRIPSWVILWGESSYILYLAHLLVFGVSGTVMRIVFGIDVYTSTPFLITLLLGIIVLSMLLSWGIERPYQNWYRRRFISKS